MKRIFLTSGLVLCMACPAFAADPTGFGSTTTGNQPGACVNDTIGTYSVSTKLVAQWADDYAVMALDENDGDAVAKGGVTGTVYPSATANDNLYLTPYNSETGAGAGVYKRTGNGTTQAYVFTQLNATTNKQALTEAELPTGRTVGYNLTVTLPKTGNANPIGTPTGHNTTGLPRQFLGYFATASSSTPYINASGELTEDGVTAAATYNNNSPWVAQYSLVSPSVTNPSVYGYTFNGWKVGDGETVYANTQQNPLPGNIGVDTELVAQWTPHTYTVEYSCGTGASGTVANQTITYAMANFQWRGNNDKTGGEGNCTYSGKHFTGWTCTATGADSNTITFSNTATRDTNEPTDNPASWTGATVTQWSQANLANGAIISCEANWANNVITITWDGNEGTVVQPEDRTCTYEGAVTVPAIPTRTGFKFNGWKVENQ